MCDYGCIRFAVYIKIKCLIYTFELKICIKFSLKLWFLANICSIRFIEVFLTAKSTKSHNLIYRPIPIILLIGWHQTASRILSCLNICDCNSAQKKNTPTTITANKINVKQCIWFTQETHFMQLILNIFKHI